MKRSVEVRVTRTMRCPEGFYLIVNGKRIWFKKRSSAIDALDSLLSMQRFQIVTIRQVRAVQGSHRSTVTHRSTARRAQSRLVLSLFPGADLLGRGFEQAGFCVVRGPDLIWGQDVRSLCLVGHTFGGIIGGPPCQDFSKKRRAAPTGYGVEMLNEFRRLVTEAQPDWWLAENVAQVPNLSVDGYLVQRFNLNANECGLAQHRLRSFQFGYRPGSNPLVINRGSAIAAESQRCCLASEGKQQGRRTFADFCELQGLPRSFELPGLPLATKYSLVGNGVPVPMARLIAVAILDRAANAGARFCLCECGRLVTGKQTLATAACRKRQQRKRDAAPNPMPGPVTVTQPAISTFGRSHALPIGQEHGCK